MRMILWLFMCLLLLSTVLLWLGYSTGDPHYAFVGLFFFFLLGGVLFGSGVEYETGSTILTNYSYVGGNLSGTSSSVSYVFTALTDTTVRTVGIFLSIAAGAGLGIVLFNWRRGDD